MMIFSIQIVYQYSLSNGERAIKKTVALTSGVIIKHSNGIKTLRRPLKVSKKHFIVNSNFVGNQVLLELIFYKGMVGSMS